MSCVGALNTYPTMPHAVAVAVQVRDVTADGGVLKRRLQEGEGEFPVDCPLHDTSVRLHYRVRSLAGPSPGPWLADSRTRSSSSSTDPAKGGGSGPDAAPPLEVDTGCGELPEGLELVVKLMVPGELASATCSAAYAYEVGGDARRGGSGSSGVQGSSSVHSREGRERRLPAGRLLGC